MTRAMTLALLLLASCTPTVRLELRDPLTTVEIKALQAVAQDHEERLQAVEEEIEHGRNP